MDDQLKGMCGVDNAVERLEEYLCDDLATYPSEMHQASDVQMAGETGLQAGISRMLTGTTVEEEAEGQSGEGRLEAMNFILYPPYGTITRLLSSD